METGEMKREEITFRTPRALPLREIATRTDRILKRLQFMRFTCCYSNAHFTELDFDNDLSLVCEDYHQDLEHPILRRMAEEILSGGERPRIGLVLEDEGNAYFRATSNFKDASSIVTINWFYRGWPALCKYICGGYTRTANLISRVMPTAETQDNQDREKLTRIHHDLTTLFGEENLIRM